MDAVRRIRSRELALAHKLIGNRQPAAPERGLRIHYQLLDGRLGSPASATERQRKDDGGDPHRICSPRRGRDLAF